jgi:hypothetical protein
LYRCHPLEYIILAIQQKPNSGTKNSDESAFEICGVSLTDCENASSSLPHSWAGGLQITVPLLFRPVRITFPAGGRISRAEAYPQERRRGVDKEHEHI